MKEEAKQMNFEKAAQYRDEVKKLRQRLLGQA